MKKVKVDYDARNVDFWHLFRAFAVDENVTIHSGNWFDGVISPLERYVLALLVRYFKPEAILEVGTFRGTTTRLFLDNMPSRSKIYTIDLPINADFSEAKSITDKHLVMHRKVGVEFREHCLAKNVIQILGNTFDEATWKQIPNNIEFAFIDASHSYTAVKNDTEMVRKKLTNNAIIIWHDFDDAEGGLVNISENR